MLRMWTLESSCLGLNLAPSLTNCVALNNFLNLSVLHPPNWKNGNCDWYEVFVIFNKSNEMVVFQTLFKSLWKRHKVDVLYVHTQLWKSSVQRYRPSSEGAYPWTLRTQSIREYQTGGLPPFSAKRGGNSSRGHVPFSRHSCISHHLFLLLTWLLVSWSQGLHSSLIMKASNNCSIVCNNEKLERAWMPGYP